MKHLKLYKENNKVVNKDEIAIDDMLLMYKDTTELENYNVSIQQPVIRVYLEFNKKILGMDKLILLDKIVNRIKRKYDKVTIIEDIMFIALPNPISNIFNEYMQKYNSSYITNSLVDEVNNILKKKLSKLKKFTFANKYKKLFYGNEIHNIAIQYNVDENDIHITNKFCEDFHHKFMFRDRDLCEIIKNAINEKLNINVDTAYIIKKNISII